VAGISIRPAAASDIAVLHAGLSALSGEIGDPHLATLEQLRDALFGPSAVARALVAEDRNGDVAGLVLFTPLFSTARGGAGVYVSDIWVARDMRGHAVGAELLAAVAAAAADLWGAVFMKLAVHDDNAKARAFYDRLGFSTIPGETVLVLSGTDLQSLGRQE
jgi:ribosomal protein S18 acetylase RimI-like enzyme